MAAACRRRLRRRWSQSTRGLTEAKLFLGNKGWVIAVRSRSGTDPETIRLLAINQDVCARRHLIYVSGGGRETLGDVTVINYKY